MTNNKYNDNEYQKAIDFLEKGLWIPKEQFAELRESFQDWT